MEALEDAASLSHKTSYCMYVCIYPLELRIPCDATPARNLEWSLVWSAHQVHALRSCPWGYHRYHSTAVNTEEMGSWTIEECDQSARSPQTDHIQVHKQEGASRIKADAPDWLKTREKRPMSKDPLTPSDHPTDTANIVTGRMADALVNVDKSVEFEERMTSFKTGWLKNFYLKFTKDELSR